MQNLKEFLQKVRELIKIPQRWTKGTYARDNKGRSIPYDYYKPECTRISRLCLVGAICRVAGEADYSSSTKARQIIKFLESIESNYDINNLVNFNDDPDITHKDVIALLDKGIQLEQEKAHDDN